ncbi:hypothetical protein V6N12_046141 [Hibiscus sabdariffa]|uniref:Uncharacterized protein n=1 Tax=Hibiscus sabdariffa TaxID=183260 RepID=A0ABR2B6P1_9ROSI
MPNGIMNSFNAPILWKSKAKGEHILGRTREVKRMRFVKNHAAIVLLTNGVMKKVKRDFKFESRWLIEEECSRLVEEEWTSTEGTNQRGTFRLKLR